MKKAIEELSRRDFAKAAAFTTAAALVPVELFSQEPATETAAQQAAPAGPKLSPESQAEADLAYEKLIRKYGKRFSEEQKIEIKRLAAQQQSSLEKLRATEVSNGDQPATVFQIYRGEGK